MSEINAVGPGGPAPAVIPAKPAAHRWKTAVGVLAGLAIGFLAARYGFQDDASQQYGQLKTQFEHTVTQSQADLDNLQAKVDLLQGQLAVEKSTRTGLEASLQKNQAELGQARDQLAFYDQLLPAGPKGAISVRAFDVQMQGNTLQYRVLLMRNAPGDAPFNGLMQFVANGMQHGKAVKIRLEPVRANSGPAGDGRDTGSGEFALKFDQFQRSRGLLSLPDGFIPKTVTLDILEGKAVRVSRSANVTPAD